MILGIECTAHTFGIGIVYKGKMLANVRDMYRPEKGGIVPMDAARHHKEVAEAVYQKALQEAGIDESEIKGIALSNAPGLAPCLIEGMKFAKRKAKELGVKMIPVNHCIAHLEIGQHEGAKDPVLLYASGANTQIIAFSDGKYRVFGETLDSGVGNFIDTFARHCGIAFPGGPEIERLALKGKYIELPYSIKGMDVSFSGMQTKMKQLYDKGEKIENLSYSMQETAFAMLVEAAERALAHTGKKELVLGGGVACNSRLQEMAKIMCRERGAKYYCPEKPLLVDNGAMIAFTGELMITSSFRKRPSKSSENYNSKLLVNPDDVDIRPRERTDDVKVTWR